MLGKLNIDYHIVNYCFGIILGNERFLYFFVYIYIFVLYFLTVQHVPLLRVANSLLMTGPKVKKIYWYILEI